MKFPPTVPVRYRAQSSIHNIIQIQNGTFYRQHPGATGPSAPTDSNLPLFANLDFSLPAVPLKRDASNWKEQQHWAVIGVSGATTFLNILRGTHICIPPHARTFPYYEIEAKDHRLRSPSRAIQYVGFTSGKGLGMGGGIRGSYLSARYESRREETDWSVLQYLKGETELNPSQELQGKDASFNALLSQVIGDLRLERFASMPVSNLSNGQTRRARIAKALLGRPEVLLLDEPFMGLDPPTLVSLSPILRELAYKSSPRLIMSLRPQDPIPDWTTHLAILGHEHTLALAGPKHEVLFAVHRWANAYGSPRSGTAAKMAALMTQKYGQPSGDIGHRLSTDGVSPYRTYSSIMESKNLRYVQPTGEITPDHLSSTDREVWQTAAEKPREKASLDDLLALTCLVPADFSHPDEVQRSPENTDPVDQCPRQSNDKNRITTPTHDALLEPLIELHNVVVAYGSKTVLGQSIQAGFSSPGVNLTVRRGTRLALLGPNGSGKTTFLSLLTSDHPQSYSLPIKYFGRSRLPSRGKPGLSLWEIQSRIGHSSPETHAFFPKGLTIRRTLESAWADTFAAKPQLTDDCKRLVNAFLGWWEPELNPLYHAPSAAEPSTTTTVDGWISASYPPIKHSSHRAHELDWASSEHNTFGTLPFQSQRLLLLLRAIIKSPDIVILDEAFSGFSPEVRDKAMLFLKGGEGHMLHRHHNAAPGHCGDDGDGNTQATSPWNCTQNKRLDVETICHEVGISIDDLLVGREALPDEKRDLVDDLRKLTPSELTATHERPPWRYTFTGLSPQQALIVVSHVREEIPDLVNEYVRLPGEEEIYKDGRAVEMGRCENGSIRTVDGWSKIWGLRT